MRAGEDFLDAREAALRAVIGEAAEAARRFFTSPVEIKMKGPQDFLTQADGAVEKVIVERLRKRFPDDAYLGEEGGAIGKSDAVWIIDPIDGTANFAHRMPHFCVSIAFMNKGKVELGAIAAPMYDEFYVARRGRGATLNGKAMKVSEAKDIRQSIVELGWSSRRPARAYTAMLERVLATGATFMRAGSGALGLAYVADGRTQGYCELHINSWDCAAGLLLVSEAGGWVNDFFAGDGLRRGNPVLACAPGLRDALISVTGVGSTESKKERRAS
jgi:myo-inositol-1(or 4)-monophosphatase